MASPAGEMANLIKESTGSQVIETEEDRVQISPVVNHVHQMFLESVSSRLTWENQAQRNIRSYKAQDTVEFRSSEEESKKVFVRTTTVKTRAAFSQVMEALLANNKFPLMIESTPVPEGTEMYAHVEDAEPPPPGVGFEGDGRTMAPGATEEDLRFLDNEEFKGLDLKPGPSKDGSYVSPAKRAAEQMNKIIHDQLAETLALTHLRKAVFEACLLGTGALKGVFTDTKVTHKWEDGVYTPEETPVPKLSWVSMWDLYFDSNAMSYDECEYVIERHRFTSKQMRDLKSSPNFDPSAIDLCISRGANYVAQGFEHVVREDDVIMNKDRLWEVLEYWGYMSTSDARKSGLVVPASSGDQISVNVWVCGHETIKIMVNPFIPQRIPYFVFNYEQKPYSITGTGVPETMEDSQLMMNGFARMAVENLALAGNMVFEIDETLLVDGQTMDIFPGKIFRKHGGQPGQAVNSIKFASTANENMLMFREWRQVADESSGIPSVSHGQTGVTGVGRTASGLSTILESASLTIKTTIRNIDDDCLQPLGNMLFFWNQQFNWENIPKGDYDVIATGARSFTKREQRVQNLQTFLQLSANPALAPIIKIPTILRELAISMDMDPEEVVNDVEMSKIYAKIIGEAGGMGAQSSKAFNAQQGAAPGAQGTGAGNPTGAGNEAGANVQPGAAAGPSV